MPGIFHQACCCGCCGDATNFYLSTNTPAQVVPPVTDSTATFSQATLKMSGDESYAVIRYTFGTLSSLPTAVHIHGPAAAGENADILFDLTLELPIDTGGDDDGGYLWTFVPVGDLTVQDIIDAIKCELTYFDIHNAEHPDGEIRGQLECSVPV